jgi:hypothetical protein
MDKESSNERISSTSESTNESASWAFSEAEEIAMMIAKSHLLHKLMPYVLVL